MLGFYSAFTSMFNVAILKVIQVAKLLPVFDRLVLQIAQVGKSGGKGGQVVVSPVVLAVRRPQ